MHEHDDYSHYPTLLETKEILKILPHRAPFLLVDRILHIDLEKNVIIGQKNVTFNEPYFPGHFPETPIMPGVLIIEALAQVGCVLVHKKGFTGKIAVLLNAQNIKFRNPVRPGDTLYLRAEGLHFSSKGGRVHATAIVNRKIALEGDVSFALVKADQV